MSRSGTFAVVRLQYTPDVTSDDSAILVGCILLNPEGEAVEFAQRALDWVVDNVDDRALLEGTIEEIEEAQRQGQLSSMWQKSIRHWSLTIASSAPEETGATDMLAARKALHQALSAPAS